MKSFCSALAIVCVVSSGGLEAQTPTRVPIIAGNYLVNVLVELDGTVKTWGDPHALAGSPSLGDGTKPGPEVKQPRLLSGVTDVVDAAVGTTQVLLLKRDGTVLAWGDNDQCEVGTGDDRTRLSPVPVAGLRNVRQVAAGESVSGAVLQDGTVWMWGSGKAGLLANGLRGWQTPCARVPTQVEGLTGVKQLAIGNSVLVVKDDGTVWGWGGNTNGELGDGTKEPRLRPVQMKGIATATAVAASDNALVVLADGTVRMCGSNIDGALGDVSPRVKEHLTPFQVPGLTGVRSALMDNGTVFVHLADGTVRGWGVGYHGALGDGHGDQLSSKPHAPTGLGPVLAHYQSGNAGYAIRADGTVMVWGILAEPGGKTEFVLTPLPAFTVKLTQ